MQMPDGARRDYIMICEADAAPVPLLATTVCEWTYVFEGRCDRERGKGSSR